MEPFYGLHRGTSVIDSDKKVAFYPPHTRITDTIVFQLSE